jgi:hypothetical protein
MGRHDRCKDERSGATVNRDLCDAVRYIGFEWGTPDDYNSFQIFDGASLLASYTGTAIGPNTSFAAYANFSADSGEVFTKIVFSSSGCCFETDNLSYIEAAGEGVPEPATFFAPILAAGRGLFCAACGCAAELTPRQPRFTNSRQPIMGAHKYGKLGW